MGTPAELLHEECDEDPAEVEAAWAEAIRQRVEGIRNGTGEWYDLKEVLAEMDRFEAELDAEDLDEADDDEDEDPVEVEAAWAAEIQRRVEEIRSGSAKTYAAEDVIAAMRIRFG